jgi:hypothetical protein
LRNYLRIKVLQDTFLAEHEAGLVQYVQVMMESMSNNDNRAVVRSFPLSRLIRVDETEVFALTAGVRGLGRIMVENL